MPTQFDPFVQVAGFIRALTNLHDNVVQNTQDWMTELQRTLDNSSREFAAAMAQFEKEQDEAFKVIALGGWVGMERHFTSLQARVVHQLHNAEGDVAMNNAVADYFNRNDCALLSEMVDTWSRIPYLSLRKSIIEDVLWAHRQGRSTVSIPALLPLAEGLSADIMGGPVRDRNVVKAVARDWKLRETEIWSEVFADVVEHVIYRYYDFYTDPAPYLSRHGILHDRVSNYATPLNSVRVFLLIDAIGFLWLDKQRTLPP